MTEQRKSKLKRQLQESRFRLIMMFGEFAETLMDMTFVATKYVYHISTNGKCIYFDPDWLQKLGKQSTDFILCHELMHIELNHIYRYKYFKGDRYHLSCDIVANANLSRMGFQFRRLRGIGTIYIETFCPRIFGSELTSEEAFDYVPFDPSSLSEGKRRTYMIDSEAYWDKKDDRGKYGDVVLSPSDINPTDIKFEDTTGGGYILSKEFIIKNRSESEDENMIPSENQSESSKKKDDDKQNNDWESMLKTNIQNLRNMKQESTEIELYGNANERIWQKPNNPKIDWRKLLDSFVQQEVFDYSFTPPDKRFSDSEFFLPDYNETTDALKEIWFMVDTSGSVSDDILSAIYNEICGALEQFNNAITGKIMFFDTKVYKPAAIDRYLKIGDIIPVGGGGTDYKCIFQYLSESQTAPSCLVIFTDGRAAFPDESEARNIPVLWLFSDSNTSAPWGKCSTIRID